MPPSGTVALTPSIMIGSLGLRWILFLVFCYLWQVLHQRIFRMKRLKSFLLISNILMRIKQLNQMLT